MRKGFRKFIQHINKHWYGYSIFIIIFISAFLRFYSFFVTWSFGSDDARDVMIAAEALRRHEIPFVGPFSSAGPFVTGPLYYWLLMPSVLFLPLSLAASWIYLIILSTALVGICIILGRIVVNREFSLVFGILAATSPQFITRSYALTNPTLVIFWTIIVMFFYTLFIKRGKILYAFLTGVSLGIALNMHYQALNLLIFLPTVLFIPSFTWGKRFTALLFMLLGFLLPLLPILTWDAQQHFANIRNVLDYFLIGQYRMYVPNSWRIFLFSFLPSIWGDVIGGYAIDGSVLFILTCLYFAYVCIRFKYEQAVITALTIVFVILLGVNRYYHGLRTEGYVLYLSPFILLFSSLVIYSFYKTVKERIKYYWIRYTFILLVAAITVLNINSIKQTFQVKQASLANLYIAKDQLAGKYPGQSFQLYDYEGKHTAHSIAFSLLLYQNHLESPHGRKVGIGCHIQCLKYPLLSSLEGDPVVDLSDVENLQRQTWDPVTGYAVYDSLIGWSNRHSLQSSFNLTSYLTSKFHFHK